MAKDGQFLLTREEANEAMRKFIAESAGSEREAF
jgi:hypothetical protein